MTSSTCGTLRPEEGQFEEALMSAQKHVDMKCQAQSISQDTVSGHIPGSVLE